MTKRDNELTRHELMDKRAKQLFDAFDMHRGVLPQQLLTAVEGLRKAHAMKDVPHRGAFPEPEPVVSDPVTAGTHDEPAKPGDLT